MFRLLVVQPIPVIVLIVIGGGFIALALIRWLVKLIAGSKKPLDISSPISGMAATAFVFIAALLSSQIQSDVTSARQSLYKEVAAIQMISLHSEVLPVAERAAVKKNLNDYVNIVVKDEWKAMQHEGESSQARASLSSLLRLIHKIEEPDVRDALRQSVTELMAARMDRLRIASDTIPAITWIILFSLGLFTKFAIALNHGDHHQWQRVIGITVTLLTSLIFIMLLVHDQPYARPNIVNPKALTNALK